MRARICTRTGTYVRPHDHMVRTIAVGPRGSSNDRSTRARQLGVRTRATAACVCAHACPSVPVPASASAYGEGLRVRGTKRYCAVYVLHPLAGPHSAQANTSYMPIRKLSHKRAYLLPTCCIPAAYLLHTSCIPPAYVHTYTGAMIMRACAHAA